MNDVTHVRQVVGVVASVGFALSSMLWCAIEVIGDMNVISRTMSSLREEMWRQ